MYTSTKQLLLTAHKWQKLKVHIKSTRVTQYEIK